MQSAFDSLLARPPFSFSQTEKETMLLPLFKELTASHKNACPAYRKIVDLAFPNHEAAQTLADIPYLPLSLFKNRRLRSVPEKDIRVTLRSSGTTGAQKSQVDLDTATAQLAARTLASTLKSVIGEKRLPLLVIDTPGALRNADGMGARAAAILGLMPFGRDHAFVLRDDLSLNVQALEEFLLRHEGENFLIYGFTYLVWQKFLPACETQRYDLSKAILLHSGGWKTLRREYIDNETFKSRFRDATSLGRAVNFYGMAEMPGAIFLENTDGLLYVPAFAEVIIRDPVDFTPLEEGKAGIIQIMNLVPRSYPGHSLLTEDIGVVYAIDTGENGWKGKALHFLGRAPQTVPRGCSNAIMAEEKNAA